MKRLAYLLVLAVLAVPAIACSDPTMPTTMPTAPLTCSAGCGPDDIAGGGGGASPRQFEELQPEVFMAVPPRP
jgi:hypothetical protein